MVTASHHPTHRAVQIVGLATSLLWTATVQAESTWYVDDDGPALGGYLGLSADCGEDPDDRHFELGVVGRSLRRQRF